jgi:hypothetical protein
MTTRQRFYRSYLLRMWQVADGEALLWRASVEVPGTGERRGFGSLEELCRWIRGQDGVSGEDAGADTKETL